jgi:hypothetical protein
MFSLETCPRHFVQGNTIAHYCYEYGFLEGIKFLLSIGQHDLTHKVNDQNQTPLHLACENGHYDIVEWQLHHNDNTADYVIQDNVSGYTLSLWLVTYGKVALLHEFMKRGYINDDLLTKHRSNTHFTLAIQKNQPEVVSFLYRNGLMGRHGIHHVRDGAILAAEILTIKKPQIMFNVLKHLNLNLFSDIYINRDYLLRSCIEKKCSEMFVCFVLEGWARPTTSDLHVFEDLTSDQRGYFIDALRQPISKYLEFVDGFLLLTVQTSSQNKCSHKQDLLRRLPSHVNQNIAHYLGIRYGIDLLYLYESIAFIESF